MSESKRERRAGRADRGAASGGVAAPQAPTFSVVASGENVVLVNTHTGQTWAMGSDGGRPLWQPVAFEAGAMRAPRRSEAKKDEAED
jgi:hypothetical protein